MKIHVVQKGETLWEIAQKYGADFNEVVQLNSHLSNPDMIMPGMKIRIPSASKQVKKENLLDKEMKEYPKKEEKEKQTKKESKKESPKPTAENPMKNSSPKPIPVIKEDDAKKPVSGKEGFSLKPGDFPKIPMVGQFLESNKTAMNIPEFLKQGKEKEAWNKEKDKKGKGEKSDQLKKSSIEAPNPGQQHVPYVDSQMEQVAPGQYVPPAPMPAQPSVMPMGYYPPVPQGMPMNPVPYPVEYSQAPYTSSYPAGEGEHESPADLYPPQIHPQQVPGLSHGYPGYGSYGQGSMESSSSLEMPSMPQHLTSQPNPCGCGGRETIGYYAPQPYGLQQGMSGAYPYGATGYPGSYSGIANPYGSSFTSPYTQPAGYYPVQNYNGYPSFIQQGYQPSSNYGYSANYPFSGNQPPVGSAPGYGMTNQPPFRPDDEESE